MSADPPVDPPDDGPGDGPGDGDDLRAAELALGLLTGEARAEAQARRARDPGFARQVAGWERRFSALADTLTPVPPNRATKPALMRRIGPPPGQAPGVWRRLRAWQAVSALAVVLLAAVLLVDPRPASGPLYTAEILSEAGDFRVVALVDKSTDEVILTRTAGAAPPGRILQVWAHGPGAPAESVGLWPGGDTVRLPLPPTIAAVEGVLTLGVSEEPPGGSPTGAPSGRVYGTVDIPGVARGL